MSSTSREPQFGNPVLIPAHDKNSLELIDMYACRIDAKTCSVVVKNLAELAPLGPLNHAKRIRKYPQDPLKLDILLIPVHKEDAQEDEDEEIDSLNLPRKKEVHDGSSSPYRSLAAHDASSGFPLSCLPPSLAEFLIPFVENLFIAHVPRYAPHSKADQTEWGRHWPVALRPMNKIARRDHHELSLEEIKAIQRHMKTVWKLTESFEAHRSGKVCNACILVEPPNSAGADSVTGGGGGSGGGGSDSFLGTVRGQGVDGTHKHPLHHAVMVAVEAVAAWQKEVWYSGGGAAEGGKVQEERKNIEVEGKRETERVEETKRRRVEHSAARGNFEIEVEERSREAFRASGEDTTGSLDNSNLGEKESSVPYLCTGYDCYVLHEPCAMCAMALVHSRARRVIFCHVDERGGALGGSGLKLHSKRTLNHHYIVYRLPLIS